MKKTKNLKLRYYTIVAFIILISNIFYHSEITSYAASATIGFSSKDTTTTVGDTVEIALTIKSSSNIGDFEAFVTYDSHVLEFREGGAFIAGGDGLLKISDINTTTSSTTKKYVITFKALDTGACEISLKDKANVYDFDEGNEMSVSSNQISVNVKATKVASSNAYLKSLKISPGTLTPHFVKEAYKYNVTVPNRVSSLVVSAIPEERKAKVTVQHADNLAVGDNKVLITVKAESGDIKEYRINVTREGNDESDTDETTANEDSNSNEDQNDGNNDNDSLDSQSDEEKTIHAFLEAGNIVLKTNSNYQIVEVTDRSIVPKGYIKTDIKMDDITVTAYTLEDDLENEFLLIYAKNSKGEEQFYQYDRVEQTLQRYKKSTLNNNNTVSDNANTISISAYNEKKNQHYIIIAILISFNILNILIIIRMFMKRKGYNDDLD